MTNVNTDAYFLVECEKLLGEIDIFKPSELPKYI